MTTPDPTGLDPGASVEPRFESPPWAPHLIALTLLLFALFVVLVGTANARFAQGLILGFIFLPLASVYTLVSSLLLVALHRGLGPVRPLSGWRCVAVAHGLGLATGLLVTLLLVGR